MRSQTNWTSRNVLCAQGVAAAAAAAADKAEKVRKYKKKNSSKSSFEHETKEGHQVEYTHACTPMEVVLSSS